MTKNRTAVWPVFVLVVGLLLVAHSAFVPQMRTLSFFSNEVLADEGGDMGGNEGGEGNGEGSAGEVGGGCCGGEGGGEMGGNEGGEGNGEGSAGEVGGGCCNSGGNNEGGNQGGGETGGGNTSTGGPVEAGPNIEVPPPPIVTPPPPPSSSSGGEIVIPPPPIVTPPPPPGSTSGGGSSSSGGIVVPPPPIVTPPPPPGSTSGGGSSTGGGSSSSSGGGGSSTGGGGTMPNVELTRVTGSSPLASFVSVNLGSIPYTGVGDTLFTYFFLFGLLGLSAMFSYGMVYAGGISRSLQVFQPLASMGDDISRIALSMSAAVKPYADLLNPFMPLTRPAAVAAVMENIPLSVVEEVEESAIAAIAPVSLVLRKETDVVDLVSQIRTLKAAPIAPKAVVGMGQEEKVRIAEMLVSYAREKEILLSEDAAALILSAADGKAEQAQNILSELTEVAHAWYEKPEYSWLSLSATRVREMLFSTYLSMVPMFVRWLAAGNSTKSSALLHMLDAQGHNIPEFLKGAAYELDKVHRFRTVREVGANEQSLTATAGWSLQTLESAITALIGSGDESYSSPLLGARLAVSRVMDMAARESRKDLLSA